MVRSTYFYFSFDNEVVPSYQWKYSNALPDSTLYFSSTCPYSRLHKIVKYFTSCKMLYMIPPFLCVTMSLFQSSHCIAPSYRKVSYTLPGVSFYLTCNFPCLSFTMLYLTLRVKNDNTHHLILLTCTP